jgi:hypothetical protein
MLIDKSQRTWILATLGVLALAAGVYVLHTLYILYTHRLRTRFIGGSPLGLTYGIVGFALMLFAGLLGARKRVRAWRVGRAQTWMRGHLWLGILSFPLILFHGGFAFGGPLTTVLMILFIIVTASGVLGAALQHFLPTRITADVTKETILDKIPPDGRSLPQLVYRAQQILLCEADELVGSVCGRSTVDDATTQATARGWSDQAAAAVAAPVEVDKEERERLSQFYRQEMRPFLEKPQQRHHPLASAGKAKARFEELRARLPQALHDVLEQLENICEEERQLNRQVYLHKWLHGWLLVHVPLSLALLLLGAVHAIVALRY